MSQQIPNFATNSFFSGAGGLDLGLELAGFKTVSQCEIEIDRQAVLRTHWPEVALHGDITTIKGSELEPANVICGGFPCQDVSHASRHREGLDGRRTGLFYQLARVIGEVRPRYVIMENVPGLVQDGLDRVLGTLADLGYDAEWEIIQANWFGLPHVRKRVFIVAHPSSIRRGIFKPVYSRYAENVERGLEDKADLPTLYDGDTPFDLAECLRTNNGLPLGVDEIKRRLAMCGNAVCPPVARFVGELVVNAEASS